MVESADQLADDRLMDAFRHEALFYVGDEEFLAGTVPFVRDGVAAGEPVLVAVAADKADQMRERLGDVADQVQFADMAELGRNPGRIISAWKEFVAAHEGKRMRGIGEPIWPGRSPDEVLECQHHEALLNVAFDDGPPWILLCPYDASALDEDILEGARRSHPHLVRCGEHHRSDGYRPGATPFEGPLSAPPRRTWELRFDGRELATVRSFVAAQARGRGLSEARAADLEIAVNELAGNSVSHGGGMGAVRVWVEDESLVCEVRDGGRIEHPLAGRECPPADRFGGRGLWMVHQLCDFVQVRSGTDGTIVRAHMALPTS
jgi:anti-sigma regulatory factor (Ser/Thr protein kinase)